GQHQPVFADGQYQPVSYSGNKSFAPLEVQDEGSWTGTIVYFLIFGGIAFMVYHNRHKILTKFGGTSRRNSLGSRRRPSSTGYKPLQTNNLDEVLGPAELEAHKKEITAGYIY
ncbi:unnamed protein product, partial [Cyprideis torosa]